MRKWFKKSSSSLLHDEELGDRALLLQQSNLAEDSLKTLGESRRTLSETNQIGTDVMSQLLNQRDGILRTKQYVEDTSTVQLETRGLISSIHRSEFYSKLLMYITIFLLCLAIFLVSIYKMVK